MPKNVDMALNIVIVERYTRKNLQLHSTLGPYDSSFSGNLCPLWLADFKKRCFDLSTIILRK